MMDRETDWQTVNAWNRIRITGIFLGHGKSQGETWKLEPKNRKSLGIRLGLKGKPGNQSRKTGNSSWDAETEARETGKPQMPNRNNSRRTQATARNGAGETNASDHIGNVLLTRQNKKTPGIGPSGPRKTWQVHPQTELAPGAQAYQQCLVTATRIPRKPKGPEAAV
jgi:hypothetical protein